MTATTEYRSIASGPIRRSLERLNRGLTEAGDAATIRNWNSGWGAILLKRGAANQLPITTGAGTVGARMDIAASGLVGVTNAETFRAIEGRQYRFTYFCRAWGVSGSPIAMSARMIAYLDGIDVTATWADDWVSKGPVQWAFTLSQFTANCVAGGGAGNLTPGAHTFQFVAATDAAGTHSFYQVGSFMAIEDLGPVSLATPVTAPTTSTSWTPLTINWSVAHTLQMRKVNDETQLRGGISWATPFGSNPLITLPAGYRPPNTVRIPSWQLDAATSTVPIASSPLSVIIAPAGTVSIFGLSVGVNSYIPLDNIRYSTTP